MYESAVNNSWLLFGTESQEWFRLNVRDGLKLGPNVLSVDLHRFEELLRKTWFLYETLKFS